MVSSIESRIDSTLRIDGCTEDRLTEEIFLSTADFEREKTKDRMSVYVGDERKRSWSEGWIIRRVGFVEVRVDGSGGTGRVGVSGTGRGFRGEAFFLRGMRRGSFSS